MAGVKIFVTGGARSGKSAWALKAAESLSGEKYFIATAEPIDAEMEERIEKHRNDRPKHWKIVEEPVDLPGILRQLNDPQKILLIDCLGIWASNVLFKDGSKRLLELLPELSGVIDEFAGSLVFVSNEVGMGIVPADRDTRLYRDLLGTINQTIAARCETAVLLASGLPLFLKGKLKPDSREGS